MILFGNCGFRLITSDYIFTDSCGISRLIGATMATGGGEDDILEGFLCPICKADLKSAAQLTGHFESLHQEEQDVLSSLRDIFGKAKKKILNLDEAELKETFDRSLRFNNSEPYFVDDVQTVGATRSCTDYFRAVRASRLERYAAETNKLLIRLDKLVSNMPADPAQRKQYEQDVVPWLDGTSVNLCPNCAKAFNLARRKHHCRLCGSLQCHDCSLFLHLHIAKRMVDPSLTAAPAPAAGDAEGLRLCVHCYGLVELRRQVQDSRNTKSVLVTAYEQMRSLMEQGKPLVAMYEKMCQSLFDGETTYNLTDVNAVRGRIGKLAEGIDLLSKQIASLPADPASREHKLHNSIRQAATQYIKDGMLSLRKLPTDAQIASVRRERYERAERQIEAERRRQAERPPAPASLPRAAAAASPRASHAPHDDPILEQMNIIRGYIKQARQDMKFEEVAMLEANLKELKKEYQLQLLSSKT